MTVKRKAKSKTLRKRRTPWMFYGVLALAFVLASMGGVLIAPFVIPHVPYLKHVEGYKSTTVFQFDCTRFFKEHLL